MRTAFCSAAACGALLSSLAIGDDAALHVTVEPYARHAFDADLDGGASVAVSRAGANVIFDKKLSDTAYGSVKLLGEYSHYNFAPGDGVLDDGVTIELRPSLINYYSDHFNVYGGASVGASGETDADISNALYYGGYVGFSYKLGDGVWIGTGVGAQTQLEDDLLFVPLFTLDWNITDKLNLSANGLSGTLTYTIDKAWSVYLDARYEYRQFRLNDAPGAPLPDGVLRDETVPISLGATWHAGDSLSLSAAGGVVAWRNIELRDNDEHRLSSPDADPTGFVSVSLKWAF